MKNLHATNQKKDINCCKYCLELNLESLLLSTHKYSLGLERNLY